VERKQEDCDVCYTEFAPMLQDSNVVLFEPRQPRYLSLLFINNYSFFPTVLRKETRNGWKRMFSSHPVLDLRGAPWRDDRISQQRATQRLRDRFR